DVFAAAVLNAQPMGFYAPAQIVRDVREHGVEVRPVDINFSDYDATLEKGPRAAERLHELHRDMAGDISTERALRLGLREIKGLSEDHAELIAARRNEGYASVRDLWLRTGLAPRILERLADADAFGSLGLTRRQALWAVKALGRAGDQDDLPLLSQRDAMHAVVIEQHVTPKEELGQKTVATGFPFPLRGREHAAANGEILLPFEYEVRSERQARESHREPPVALPAMPLGEEVVNDYRFLKLSLRAHPASFLRADLKARGIVSNAELRARASDTWVRVSGLVTIRQRPGSASGVIFMTIEDETAIANIIVWPKVFERFRPIVLGARYIAVSGKLQQESGVIHVVADRLDDLTALLGKLLHDAPPIEALARADAVKRPHAENREKLTRTEWLARFRAAPQEISSAASDLDVPARGSAHTPTRKAPSRS
ncbi:MAG TPA: OB-fold nucleic acid binding domain-containing protein, partial [Xanthobacteraceae bacterium]|nr:OB-fold nucleic acid binding domain-containing protein [Xanthobacteraceae bacterium]